MTRSNRLLTTIVAATIATSAIGTYLSAQTAPATPPVPATQGDNTAKAMVLVEKAKELFQADKILDAKTTNDAALKLAPDLLAAKVMDAQIKVRIAAMAAPVGGGVVNPATNPANPANPANANPTDKLSNMQINRMRAYETSAADKTLAGTVDMATLGEFWKDVLAANPGGRDKEGFLKSDFAEQVRAFKESGQNTFIDKLKITGDPVSMKAFKEINTWTINNCTYQPGCHAMDNSTLPFRIYTKGGETPANIYTNFYMMQKIQLNGQDLLDRGRPESSLLAQFGLPPKDASATHPATKTKIPQRFIGVKDANYVRLVKALDELKVVGTPSDYGFGGSTTPASVTPASTAPAATAPATTSAATTTAPAK